MYFWAKYKSISSPSGYSNVEWALQPWLASSLGKGRLNSKLWHTTQLTKDCGVHNDFMILTAVDLINIQYQSLHNIKTKLF